MNIVEIERSLIGEGQAPYVIAEVGINHNGDVERAFAMIRAAKAAGADAVKFQTFRADEFIGDPEQTYTYKSQGREVTESMLEMFQRYEFAPDEWRRVRSLCEDVGITFLSTPQNRSDLDLLLELGVAAIKVGSDDLVNTPLLRDYASTGLPILLSSGMASIGEVEQALDAVGAFDGYPALVFMCVAEYPAPPEDVNLRKIATLRAAFPGVPIGFSDHTQGPVAAAAAVALGACVFEKHFTLDHELPGPDHWFSEDVEGLTQWVGAIRAAHSMMGSPLVRPTGAELTMRAVARRSVVVVRSIEDGEMLTTENVGLRRPGTGLPPSALDDVLGLHAHRALAPGTVLTLADLS